LGKKKHKKKIYDKSVLLGAVANPETQKERQKEERQKIKEKAKARQQAKSNEPKEPVGKRIVSYFRGVRTETRKVVWPTRKETVTFTITVLVACAFFGILFWILDTTFLGTMQSLFSVKY
jgi:preprotein translocase subunit SecE